MDSNYLFQSSRGQAQDGSVSGAVRLLQVEHSFQVGRKFHEFDPISVVLLLLLLLLVLLLLLSGTVNPECTVIIIIVIIIIIIISGTGSPGRMWTLAQN